MKPADYVAIARICHEANRGYCASLGDQSQVPWEEAPQWQKESAVVGVKAIEANPNLPPSASHEGWSAQKLADGWKYGPVKDADKKEHPCLVPFADLPKEQQAKDFIFGAVARALLAV
jgi:hypothetical protein